MQPVIVEAADEEAATLTSGGDQSPGVRPPGRRSEDDDNLVVETEEPQTFDWQLSGGGKDTSFRGKGRSWIEDKPGTARSLTSNKTLAVHVPGDAVAFQQTPQGDVNEDDVSPPVLGRGGSVGNNTPMVATGLDTQNQHETGDLSPTLRTVRPGSSTGQDDSVPAVLIEEPVAFDWTGDDPGNTPAGETPPLSAGHAGELAIGFLAGSSAATGGIGAEDEIAPTLGSVDNGSTRTPTVAYTKSHGATDVDDAELWEEAEAVRSLNSTAFATDVVVEGDVDETVAALTSPKAGAGGSYRLDEHEVMGGHLVPEAEAFETRFARNGRGAPSPEVPPLKAQSGQTGKGDAPALGTPSGHMGQGTPSVRAGAAVRRLTPRECERLQGAPDDWTKLEDGTPDGPRYAAIGDGVSVPVPVWIIRRLLRREALQTTKTRGQA